MLKTLIISDEINFGKTLANQLAKHLNIDVIGQWNNLLGGAGIYKYKPDLIFIDTETQDINALELIMLLKQFDCEIIFVTAGDEDFIYATRFNSLNFLSKPVTVQVLKDAVRKATHKFLNRHHRQKIETMLEDVKYLNTGKKIALATLSGIEFVTIGDIVRCESDNTYTIFHMMNQSKIVVNRSIGEYEIILIDDHFLRIHQSHLINLRHIKKYNKGNGGNIIMEGGTILEVSRRRKEQLLNKMSLT